MRANSDWENVALGELAFLICYEEVPVDFFCTYIVILTQVLFGRIFPFS